MRYANVYVSPVLTTSYICFNDHFFPRLPDLVALYVPVPDELPVYQTQRSGEENKNQKKPENTNVQIV